MMRWIVGSSLRLRHVVVTLAAEVPGRDSPQLGVDQRHHLIGRIEVAPAPSPKQLGVLHHPVDLDDPGRRPGNRDLHRLEHSGQLQPPLEVTAHATKVGGDGRYVSRPTAAAAQERDTQGDLTVRDQTIGVYCTGLSPNFFKPGTRGSRDA